MGLSYIKTRAATQEYRDNWERIFGEEGPIGLTGLVDPPKEKAPTPVKESWPYDEDEPPMCCCRGLCNIDPWA